MVIRMGQKVEGCRHEPLYQGTKPGELFRFRLRVAPHSPSGRYHNPLENRRSYWSAGKPEPTCATTYRIRWGPLTCGERERSRYTRSGVANPPVDVRPV